MKRNYISSSGIKSIGYDPENLILEVEFINQGVYQYFAPVPPEDFEELMKSESKGEHFNKVIRPKNYEFSKIK